MESLIRAAVALGGGILILTGGLSRLNLAFDAIATATRSSTGNFLGLGGAVRDLGRDLGGIGNSWGRYRDTIGKVDGAHQKLSTSIKATVFGFARFAVRLTGIIGIIASVVEFVNLLIRTFTGVDIIAKTTEKLGQAWDYVRERFLGFKKEAEVPVEVTADMADFGKKTRDALEAQRVQAKAITDAQDDQRKKSQETVGSYQAQNTELLKQYGLQTGLIGLSEANAERAQELFNFEQARVAAVAPLEREIAQLSRSRNELDQARIPIIQAAIDKINQEAESTRQALESSINLRERARAIQKQQLDLEAALTRQAEAREQVEEAISEITLRGRTSMRDAADQARLATLTGVQKKLAEIEIEERRVADAARARVAEQYAENPEALAAALKRIDDASQRVTQLRQQQAQSIDQEQTQFSTGWNQALNEYLAQTQDAASQARSLFQNATKGMEDAIVGFVRTGKLNFKDFLGSIAEMILRSQVQKLIGSLFGGGGGGSTGGSFLGSLFAGFFADGGRIPSGRFGVVGEAGPELVSGPATVTPMGDLSAAGATSVVYNISAVDAASFQSLLARDPEFLFAITEKGRRSLPGSRR
jgi:lambda family phage tail tape measure protein